MPGLARSFALIATVLAPLPALAWGGDGHRIVCAIAWDELQPGAQDKVKQLLGVGDRAAFAETCLWADQYRDQEGHRETHDWHVVYVPPYAKTVDVSRDCSSTKSCAVVQIGKDVETLKNASTPASERAMALKFLSHFVGDVHEPLHVAFIRDDGGSTIKGTFLGRETTLHTLWDEGLLKADGRPWPQIADALEADVSSYDRYEWNAAKPVDWANESLAVTLAPDTRYADGPQTFAFGRDYQLKNLPVVLDRLTRAGVRLGHVLNDIFAS